MKKLTLTLLALLCAVASFADSIFIEGFEYANHDGETPVGWTCSNQSWLCGYQEKDHNRAPHTGNWYAYTNAEESWMFMPLYFSSQIKYRFSGWAVSDGDYELEFWMGDEADASQMTHQLSTFSISGGEYEKVAVYIETLSSNYEYFGIRAIAHEGAFHLTIDDILVDMVTKYEFIATPSNADTVLFPGTQASYHFTVQNLGYIPIQVIFSPSHEYFGNFHFYVDGNACSSFHLEPDEAKEVIAEATLLPSVPVGSICWLDIMLLLDCDCATAMTTLWVTVLDPSGTLENKETTILAPNPAYDHILIHEKGLRQVDILDTTGKKVFTSASGDDELRIDLTCLQAGIYLVNIITDRGSSVQKMVKR